MSRNDPSTRSETAARSFDVVIDTYNSSIDTGFLHYGGEGDSLSVLVDVGGALEGGNFGFNGSGGELLLVNRGAIRSDGIGLQFFPGDGRIINHGSITGGTYGLAYSSEGGKSVNHGTITGDTAVIFASFDGRVRFENQGSLNGTGGQAVDGTKHRPDLFANSGFVTGSVKLESGNDRYVNSGQQAGNVLMGGGQDMVENSGLIRGDVHLGAGRDLFIAQSGMVGGTVYGGKGNDRFIIREVSVSVDGGTGVDTVVSYRHFYSAGGVERILLKGDGNFNAVGDGGENRIIGNSGDNILFGDEGNDVLRAGDGDDILVGGDGRDILLGGAGADQFVFDDAGDSGPGGKTRDLVQDFERGQDLIDVSALEALRFAGLAGHDGSGPSLAYSVTGAGHALVTIDLNGDGQRDMSLLLRDVDLLTEADFIL